MGILCNERIQFSLWLPILAATEVLSL